MTHLKGAVWTERLLLVLILASLAGTLNLVLAIHRRVNSIAGVRKAEPIAQPEPPPRIVLAPAPPSSPAAKPTPSPVQPPAPPRPVEDPTAEMLAKLDRAIAREVDAARESDGRTAKLEAGIRTSIAESQRWKRREMLVRQQVATLSRRADELEQDALTMDAERDVLARERDALKAATASASQRSGYSVLPYKGPNGTWRRPIVLECSGDGVTLQPRGRKFSMMELSSLINPRSSPIVLAIAGEMLHIHQSETPDGAPAVPYLVFLVRPDGIRFYYRARERLESLGIAFGYELIEQDLAVDVPNFDDVKTWDGTLPLETPELAGVDARTRHMGPSIPGPRGGDNPAGSPTWPAGDQAASGDPPAAGAWPPVAGGEGKPGNDRRWPDLARSSPPTGKPHYGSNSSGGGTEHPSSPEIDLGDHASRGNRAEGDSPGRPGEASPDDFVWPTNPGDGRPRDGRGSVGSRRGRSDEAGKENGFAGMPASVVPGPDSSPGLTPGARGTDPTQGSAGSAMGSSSTGGSNRRIGSGTGVEGFGDAGRSSPGTGLESQGSESTVPGSGSTSGSAGDSTGPDPPGGGSLSPGRIGLSGRAVRSPSGDGRSRGGNDPAPRNGTGSGLANGDGLPKLEPAQEVATTSDATTAGLTASAAPGGPGGLASGGSGSGSFAKGSGPSDASSGPLGKEPASNGEEPGAGPTPAGNAGSASPDPGFASYADRPAAPVEGAAGSSSQAADGPPRAGGTGTFAPAGSAETNGPGQGTPSDGLQPGPLASRGTAGSARQGTTPDSTGSSSGTRPSMSASPARLQLSGLSTDPTSSDPGNAGLPPTPLQAALASGSSSPSSSLASALGGSPNGAMDGAAGGHSNAMGSMSGSPSSSSSGSSGDQPSSATPPGAQGMSLPSLNVNADPSSEPDSLKDLALPPIDTHRQPGRIEVPFEIVLVCRRDDLLLHPGGYRITGQALREGAGKANNPEGLLRRELRAIVHRRAQVDPLIRPKPRLKFLVETDGGTTFWTAQRQLIFSGLDWPMAVQVAGPQTKTAQLFGEGTRR